MPKTLNLQQCLTVCRHYESLKLHIEQIRPNKSVDYLKWCHNKKKGHSSQSTLSGQNSNKGSSQSNTRSGQWYSRSSYQSTNQSNLMSQQCYYCGLPRVKNHMCPAWGQTCNKCGRNNHFAVNCGKCHNVKMGLLLMKTTPVVSGHDHKAPAESFFKHQLKANVPIFWSVQWANDHDRDEWMMMSKFRNHDGIWCKIDPNTKWRPGHIIDVMPNQPYLIELEDGRQFRRNEHHITGWHPQSCNVTKPLDDVKIPWEQFYSSYNLRSQAKQSIKWPNFPVNVEQSEFNIDNL